MLTRSANKPTIDRKAQTTKKSTGHRVLRPSRRKQGPRRSTRRQSTSPSEPKPSDRWASYEGVDEFQASKIKEIFRKGDWDLLCSEAVNCFQRQLGKRGQTAIDGLTFNIMHSRFACGASNVVLEVAFSDSTYWVVRIKFPDADEDPEVEKAIHSEVATMRLIQERTSIPVATIFGYNAKQRNPFGYSFMFMSVLPGRHLDSDLASSVPKQRQAKVAGQLAEILHQLNTRMTFEMIGRIWCGENGNEEPSITSFNAIGACEGQLETYPIGPFSTSLEYFYALRQHENAAIRAGILQGILGQDDKKMWFTACRVFEQTLSQLVLMEKMAGPYPLKHMDLHFNNILFDDDFNITGILDWTAAQTVPCESFAVYVEFIVPPNAPEEASVRTSSFRNMVQRAWKKRELKSKCVCSISDVLGSVRGDLIYFSYTFGAFRRSVAYAQIVTALLYGPDFSLNNFKKHWGAPPV